MRKFIMPMLAATFFAATATLSTPAAATEIREAIKLCDANPPCGYGPPDSAGGMTITANGHIISCPAKGACSVIGARAPGSKPTRAAGNVASVLKASGPGMAKTPLAPKKISDDAKKTRTLQTGVQEPSASSKTGDTKKH